MIEALVTRLVREAPVIAPDVVEDLIRELHANRAPLALAIARIVELVAEGLVDPGIALPALASACATLVDRRSTPRVLAAAQYEIDTLEPVPDPPDRPAGAPDVTIDRVTALSRGPRRRT